MTELLSCPFCRAVARMGSEGEYHQVICQDCGSSAAEYPNPTLAALAWNTRSLSPYSGATGDAVAWRCFHCHEVFTDEGTAREHFGFSELETPACKLNATEGGIVGLVRRQAEQIEQYHREDTASYREFYSLGSDHVRALQCEEEKGYARGLADARAETPTVLPRDAERAFSQCEKCWQPATCKKYGCRFPLSRDAAAKSETPTVERPIRERLAETSGPEDGGVTAGRDPHPIIEGTLAEETAPISLSRDAERETIEVVAWSQRPCVFPDDDDTLCYTNVKRTKSDTYPFALYALPSIPSREGQTITVPFNPCLAKLRPGEPFFVLLGRDKQAPNAVMTWASDREAAEGKSAWTEEAREVAHTMAAYSGVAYPVPSREGVAKVGECDPLDGMVCRRNYPFGSSCTRFGGASKCLEDIRSPTSVMPDEGAKS